MRPIVATGCAYSLYRTELVKVLRSLTSECHRPFVVAAIKQRFKFGNVLHGMAKPALLVIVSVSSFRCVGKRF